MRTIVLAILFAGLQCNAQEIGGKILDEKKEPMINAVVMALQQGVMRGGNVSDFDGNYVIKPMQEGTYDVMVVYQGYDTMVMTGVPVTPGQRTTVNFLMQKIKRLGCNVAPYTPPLPHKSANNLDTINQNAARVYIVDGIVSNSAGIDYMQCVCQVQEITDGADYVLTKEQIDHMPATTYDDLLTIFPGVYQARRGDPVTIGCNAGVTYYLDGVRQ